MKYVTLAVLLIAGLVPPVSAEDGADLKAYIESIRASGMSEMAASQIGSVAGIVSGATILSYQRDAASGQYWTSYMSATCPKPDADEPTLTQWKKMKSAEWKGLVPRLRPFADADASGFVTTEEGSEFRSVIELGYLASEVARDGAPTIEAIARAAGRDAAATETKLREYSALAGRIADAGITGLPAVDIPELKAAQN